MTLSLPYIPAVRATVVSLLLALLTAACGTGSVGSGVDTSAQPSSSASVVAIGSSETPADPAISLTPLPALPKPASASTATASPTPPGVAMQTPDPAPCGVLPDHLCVTGEVVETTLRGRPSTFVGFRLPVGTAITLPFDTAAAGKREIKQPFPFRGFSVLIYDYCDDPKSQDGQRDISLYGDIRFDSMLETRGGRGVVVGYVADGGAVQPGGYNVVFVKTFRGPSLSSLFPAAFSRQARVLPDPGPSEWAAQSVIDIFVKPGCR